MSWKNVLSIVAASALLGVPLQTLAHNDRGHNDRDDRGHNDRNDRHHGHDWQAKKAKEKAERDARFEAQLIARYTALAGSPANADSLVKGLRNDTLVTLTGAAAPSEPPVQAFDCERFACEPQPTPAPVVVTFNSPTGPLKLKQVAIGLALMEAKLKDLYPQIVAATGEQIRDVLAGVPNGILTMRAKKMSWLHIAYKQGLIAHHTRHVKDNDDDDDDD